MPLQQALSQTPAQPCKHMYILIAGCRALLHWTELQDSLLIANTRMAFGDAKSSREQHPKAGCPSRKSALDSLEDSVHQKGIELSDIWRHRLTYCSVPSGVVFRSSCACA